MLGSFRCGLRRVMTFDARDRLGPIDTAILRDVIGVTKLYATQLCLWSKYEDVRLLLSFLSRNMGRGIPAAQD
jgi:hypothetical protein